MIWLQYTKETEKVREILEHFCCMIVSLLRPGHAAAQSQSVTYCEHGVALVGLCRGNSRRDGYCTRVRPSQMIKRALMRFFGV